MAALPGYKAGVWVTATPSVALTDDVLTDAGAHTIFNEATSAHVCWDKDTPFVVQTAPDGSTWTTVTTGFTINYPIGQIVFASPVGGGTPSCRVHAGAYYPFSFLANAKQVDVIPTVSVLDASCFTNPPSPWMQKVGALAGSTVKLSKWWIDQQFGPLITNTTRLILIAYSGLNTNNRYVGYVRIKQDSLKFAVNALETEDLDFEVDGQLYYIQS